MTEPGSHAFLQLSKPTVKLVFNSPILIKVSNWDLKRASDRLKLQKVHLK